eukprot:CAMPEP_0113305560 /NCGR_PEP_ID=MMETSP0010_2-20120614/5140_1 /TAXON_ID=216773 ORGANISM="Corethron hystrix, Strain 308" /NCGR_SAMPLE_ID=MMETSP0010_2 /ASSEMBLY_ACC=CAM_ASM_000155 /LENGTH=440 /DNA_ID=CAMNT_0000160007 /DNA_START=103 /DNA_END=1425 /DNA_ORIENTATION=- /assembly_acc=CAM_ASM_000155
MCKPSASVTGEPELAPTDKWIEKLDLAAFTADIQALGDKFSSCQGADDVRHLNKMISWSNSFLVVGLATMWYTPNPMTALCLSFYTLSRWTMIAHHTCHGGYDKVHPAKGRFNRFKFGVGSLFCRMRDWLDWMVPEAWNVEHNNRHHYCLSELDDPDLVENNLKEVREMDIPMAMKYLVVVINAMMWKWVYYAPNTYKELKIAHYRRQGIPLPKGVDPQDAVTIKSIILGQNPFYSVQELVSKVLGPYLVIHFFLLPLPYLFLGHHRGVESLYFMNAIKNLFMAEILTNAHSFLIVVTNHAGDDMYRFKNSCRPYSGSFYLRQIIASVDFSMGNDYVDFFHGWLNYQIEHHLWPNLSMLSYQKSAPSVEAICNKHGVPYIKENVFLRLKKTTDIMVGKTSMRVFPEAYERKFLDLDMKMEEERKREKEAKRAANAAKKIR